MIIIVVLIGCILGAIIGMNSPIIPYTYSGYLAIGIMAALLYAVGTAYNS